MKKNYMILALVLLIALMITACGGSTGQSQAEQNAVTQEKVESKEPVKTESSGTKSTKLQAISDLADLWDTLYNENEKIINEYQGILVMDLIRPSAAFVSGVQYDLLNLERKDGRFNGELLFAGYQGFVEKDGPNLKFGYDEVLEKDGFGIYSMAGDRKVENGVCDLDKAYFYSEEYTERQGKIITRTIYEFRQEKDGSMSCFVLSGDSLDVRGKETETKESEYLFFRNGKGQYDFVIAKGEEGPDFKVLSLKDHENLTKEKAIELFEAAGYVVKKSGGIVDGKLTLDE